MSSEAFTPISARATIRPQSRFRLNASRWRNAPPRASVCAGSNHDRQQPRSGGLSALKSNAVNPGRFLYGLLESPWRDRVAVRPVFKAVKSRLIQIKHLHDGRRWIWPILENLPSDVRVGIAAVGFASGLPRSMSGTHVLVRGKRASVIGLASMEHLLINLTGIDDAAVGDEVVLIGKQGNTLITGEAFSPTVRNDGARIGAAPGARVKTVLCGIGLAGGSHRAASTIVFCLAKQAGTNFNG